MKASIDGEDEKEVKVVRRYWLVGRLEESSKRERTLYKLYLQPQEVIILSIVLLLCRLIVYLIKAEASEARD